MTDDVLTMINGDAPPTEPVVVVEPTVATPPPAEPTAPTEPVVTAPVAEKYSLTDFGDYKSPDEVKSLLERAKKFSDNDLTELQVLRQEATRLKELQAENEKLRNTNPYKNQDYYRLQKLEETDPSMVPVYKRLVFGEPDEKELLRIDFAAKHPEFANDKAVIERYIQRKYAALYDPDIDKEDQAYKDAEFDLKLEATTIKKELRAKFDSISVPDPTQEDKAKKAEQEQFIGKWNGMITDSFKDLGKFSVEVLSEGGKGKESLFDVEIPSDARFAEQAMRYAVTNRLEPTKDNLDNIKGLMKKLWVVEHIDDYNTKIAEHVAKAKDGMWRKKINNPDVTPASKPTTDIPADPSKSLLEDLMKY